MRVRHWAVSSHALNGFRFDSAAAPTAGRALTKRAAPVQMWMELTTMRAPDYFGEAAMLGRGVRHAAAIADSAVEVLVLLKLDFDLKIDAATRDVLNVLVSQYPKDATFVRYAAHLTTRRGSRLCTRSGDCVSRCVRARTRRGAGARRPCMRSRAAAFGNVSTTFRHASVCD